MKKSILSVLCLCIGIIAYAQTAKTIEINAGGLSSALTAEEKSTLTHLTITGVMNSSDFYTIRNQMPLVEFVDLSNVGTTDGHVPGSAFENKSTLIEVRLPKTATHIDNNAFYGCNKLERVTLPDSLQYIGNQCFNSCNSLQGPLEFPPTLHTIDSYAFRYCHALSGDLVLPPKMKILRYASFQECRSLSGLVLPDSLVTIENYVFQHCTGLQGIVTFPATLTSIGYAAFDNTWLQTARVRSVTPPDLNSYSVGRMHVFHVPAEAVADYRSNSDWSTFVIIGGDEQVDITVNMNTAGTLGELILLQVDYLKDVNRLTITGPMNADDMALLKNNLPDLLSLNMAKTDVTAIPNNHFESRKTLQEVILPDSLLTIGNRAFIYCNNLQKVVVPTKIKVIDVYTFYDNYQLRDLTLPTGLTTIKEYAFQYNHSLTELVLPDSLTSMSYQAFYNCSRLQKVTVNDKLSYLPSNAFSECTSLAEVSLPDGLTDIDDYAFHNNYNLRKIQLPAKLTHIGYSAFYRCPIDTLILPPGVNNIEQYAFNQCTSLKYIRCEQPTPPIMNYDPFGGLDKTACELHVPFFSEIMYKQANVWSFFSTITPFSTEMKDLPISGALVLNNNVRPTGFPNISLLSTGSLTVGGNAPFVTDAFTMESRLNSNTWSSLLNNCPAATANSSTARFHVNANKWYFISLPFEVNVADIRAANNGLFVIRYYDGATRALNGSTGNWKNMTNDSILSPNRGYIINSNIATQIDFPATDDSKNLLFHTDAQLINLNEYPTETAAHKNWNFVGNPFPSYYDSRYIEATAPITIWNGSSYTAYSLIDDKYAVKPFEAFFVQKPDDLAQMRFGVEGRLTTATLPEQGPASMPVKVPALFKASRQLINLHLSDDNMSDRSRIVLNESAAPDYELRCDAAKFMSDDPQVLQLYSLDATATSYAINERPLGEGIVALGYRVGRSDSYRLSVEPMESELRLQLYDKNNQTLTDLLTGDYHFHSEAGSFNDRFELRIQKAGTSTDEVDQQLTFVSIEDGKLAVHTSIGTPITVYTMNGAMVEHTRANGRVTLFALPKGIYLVKAGEENFKSVVF